MPNSDDDPISSDELDSLIASRSAEEWDAACDRIKHTRGGAYPPDFWDKVQMSGLARRIKASWGAR